MNYPQSSTALVIIDMQNAYFEAGELKRARKRLTKNCNQLITLFREAQLPIIFIRTAHQKTKETWTLNMLDDDQGFLFDQSEEADMLEEIDKQPFDSVITKLRDSAFYATTLEQYLASRNVRTLVLAGISTQSCVGMTAADAYMRNIRVIVAEDAIGTHDPKYHESTLSLLEKEYRQKRMRVKEIRALLKA